MRTIGVLTGLFFCLLFSGSKVWAANGTLLEEIVACSDRGHVEKLHLILLGENSERIFVNAVASSLRSGKCIELKKYQKITISKIEAPLHVELHDLNYKMLQVGKRGSKKTYWIYDINAVKR